MLGFGLHHYIDGVLSLESGFFGAGSRLVRTQRTLCSLGMQKCHLKTARRRNEAGIYAGVLKMLSEELVN